jgi:Tfp pilus assembly protein PilF
MAHGEQSSAVEHFNRAYLYGSQYEVMYLDIAKSYQELGYDAAAIASYEKYIQLAGENADPVAQSQISILGG